VARKCPNVTWRRDLRWVTDGPITTTAGISAAEPATFAAIRHAFGEVTARFVALQFQHPSGAALALEGPST
jgi:transcriptional regulator GlxA family with amidase domain